MKQRQWKNFGGKRSWLVFECKWLGSQRICPINQCRSISDSKTHLQKTWEQNHNRTNSSHEWPQSSSKHSKACRILCACDIHNTCEKYKRTIVGQSKGGNIGELCCQTAHARDFYRAVGIPVISPSNINALNCTEQWLSEIFTEHLVTFIDFPEVKHMSYSIMTKSLILPSTL